MTLPRKRCQNCRFWTEDPEYREGPCSKLTKGSPIESGFQNCHTLLFVDEGNSQEDWGVMLTPYDFGCVLWERKE